jgi:hypothetical protein
MTTNAEPFPLDIEALHAGDVIDVARLQSITRFKHGTENYQHAIRRLAKQIERERKAMGRPVVIRQRKGALEVCTPSDQVKYAKRRAIETGKKLRRTMTVIVTTSVSELTPEEAREWERLSLNTAARMAVFSKRGPKRIVDGAKPKALPSKD